MRITSITSLCLFLLIGTSTFASTNFYTGDFESARAKAQLEGKMLFIDFHASWCAPCKWMDETVFQDESVGSLINEKFIPLKIDIDDFDGYALKEHFDVNVLPTFLIFNEEGKVVERVEETLAPSKMTAILEKSLEGFTPMTHNANLSPSDVTSLKKEGEAKEKFTIAKVQSTYKLQLGIFSTYEHTLQYYNQVSGLLDEPIIIMHDYKAGQVIYRVLIGKFNSTEDAHFYQTDLKDKFNIDSHIYI